MSNQNFSSLEKIFSTETASKLRNDPNLAHIIDDPRFLAMVNDVAMDPQNILKYYGEPNLQRGLMAILPVLTEMKPPSMPSDPSIPAPPLSNDAEEEKQLGNDCFRQKKFNEALVHYNNSIKIDPKNVVYYSNKSTTLIKLGRSEDAMEAAMLGIEQGIQNGASNENMAKAYVKLANACIASGKENGALTALHEATYLSDDLAIKKMYEDLEKKIKPQ